MQKSSLMSKPAKINIQGCCSVCTELVFSCHPFLNQFNHAFNYPHSQTVNLALHRSKLGHRNKQQFPSPSLNLSPSKHARCPFAMFSSCLAAKHNASVSKHHLGSDAENYLGISLTSSEFSLQPMDFLQSHKALLNQTLPSSLLSRRRTCSLPALCVMN